MLPGGMSTTTAGEGQRLEGVLEAAAEAAGRQVARGRGVVGSVPNATWREDKCRLQEYKAVVIETC